MFDARSLFDQIVRGGTPSAQQAPGQGGGIGDLSDLLRQFTQGAQQQTGQAPASRDNSSQSSPSGASALDDLMRQFGQRNAEAPGAAPASNTGSGSNSLEDLLRQLTQGNQAGTSSANQPSAAPNSPAPGTSGGGLGDLLGQVFGQGRDGSDSQTSSRQPTSGQQPGLGDLLEKLGGSGASTGDIMKQLTDFIGNNKVGAGAALGGLGALILGTRTGRSLAVNAAKLGALAVVGGLAYKAYQNYNQGRPLVSGSIEPEAAPAGTGFEAEEVSNDAAVTYIRGMIAASAADGRIDAAEQQQLIGTLSQQGLDAGAEEFLANELNNPASIEDLANGVSNQTEALQLYTAARVAIDPDTSAEQQFLAVLADRLGITPELRAHVDAAARGLA